MTDQPVKWKQVTPWLKLSSEGHRVMAVDHYWCCFDAEGYYLGPVYERGHIMPLLGLTEYHPPQSPTENLSTDLSTAT